jgi:hypothetical protein
MENVFSPRLVVVDMGVEEDDESVRRLSERDTRVCPIEGTIFGMILRMSKI